MQDNLFKEYVKLEAKAKEINEAKEALRAQILSEMQKSKTEKIEKDFGTFTIARRTSWSYTDAVTKIEEKLKITKAKEQDKGIAKSSVTEYILFKANV